MITSVTLFSGPLCGPCFSIKKLFANRKLPLDVKDVSVDTEAKEYIEGLGYTATPVILVKTDTGSYHFQGMQTDRVIELAKKWKEQVNP